MGDVYRASDTRLGRDVAIKLLPDDIAKDPALLARFSRETRVLASLSHPNTIHGLEKHEGRSFLVLELVTGEDLSERLAGEALPVREALEVGRQIAMALEAAHEKGIVHRDLKPANVMLTPDGAAKPLCRLERPGSRTWGRGPEPCWAPRPTCRLSSRGKPVDNRADIWAFGLVLYEMLSGRRAFVGNSVAAILASILRDDPDWSVLPSGLPPAVGVYLGRCLQKDPKERIRDIGDVRLALEGAFDVAGPAMLTGAATPPQPTSTVPWKASAAAMTTAFVGLAVITVVLAVRHFTERPSGGSGIRLDISTPTTESPLEFAPSPDGQDLLFVASGDGTPRLWLRT